MPEFNKKKYSSFTFLYLYINSKYTLFRFPLVYIVHVYTYDIWFNHVNGELCNKILFD